MLPSDPLKPLPYRDSGRWNVPNAMPPRNAFANDGPPATAVAAGPSTTSTPTAPADSSSSMRPSSSSDIGRPPVGSAACATESWIASESSRLLSTAMESTGAPESPAATGSAAAVGSVRPSVLTSVKRLALSQAPRARARRPPNIQARKRAVRRASLKVCVIRKGILSPSNGGRSDHGRRGADAGKAGKRRLVVVPDVG